VRRLLIPLLAPLLALSLQAQETPRNNRMVWLAVFPEPLPEGVNELSFEGSSQFTRPAVEFSGDKTGFARADGEEWQLTWDHAWKLGPGRLNLRLRAVERSGGFTDQAIYNYHLLFGFPEGGREAAPKNRLDYRMVKDGVTVADLRTPGVHFMDTDIAYVVPFGNRDLGGRVGASLQLPTGNSHDWSGNGGLDKLVGAAAWRTWGPWRAHGQVEQMFLGVPDHSPYRAVLSQHSLTRLWVGGGYQGSGRGFLTGLGLDITLAYFESPYRTGVPRADRPGMQQHWTFTHTALPRWKFGISEDAGTYTNPDITAFVSVRL